MSISKELYQERKSKNLCTRCGNIAELNKTLCTYHKQKANKNQQAVFARRKGKGSCRCGTKLINNRKICNNCLEKSAPNHKRDDVRIPCTDRKKLGLCTACGKQNLTSNTYCEKCSKKYSIKESLTRKQKVLKGLCCKCGKGLLARLSKTRCIICIHKNKKWYASSHYRQYHIQKQRLLRSKVIQHYGGKCVCCGISEKTFLAIDHVNGKGNAHRRKIKKSSGTNFYRWIIKQDFPGDLQILCYNCNMSKYLLDGICAHKHKQDGV